MMGRAIGWAFVALFACTALGLSFLWALAVTLTATVAGSIGYKIGAR